MANNKTFAEELAWVEEFFEENPEVIGMSTNTAIYAKADNGKVITLDTKLWCLKPQRRQEKFT